MAETAIVQAGGIDRLDVISPQFVLGLWVFAGVVSAAAIYAVWGAIRRRRHRAAISVVASFCALLMLTTATADTVNQHFAYLPTLGDAWHSVSGDGQWRPAAAIEQLSTRARSRAGANGMVVRLQLAADSLNGFAHTTNVVYLPPQYFTEPTSRFPVVYLFHGSPGRPADWFYGGQAATEGRRLAGAGLPAILVAVQMSRSWTDDPECVNGAHEKVEDHLVQEVIPAVDSRFRTQTNRVGRVFAGMSAGGYCALNLGLRHRDLVATIVDMSGYTVPTHTGGAVTLFGRHLINAPALVAANSPAVYARTLSADPATRVWLDTGTSDKTIEMQMTTLAAVLRSRGFAVQWRVRPGGHTFHVWTAAMAEALPWALGDRLGGSLTRSGDPSRPGPSGHGTRR